MERGVKVVRGDGKEVIFREDGIKIVHDGGVTFETSEATEAIQDTYSLKPDMLRNTREAADVPEEVRKEYIEAVGAELKVNPKFSDLLEEVKFERGYHLLETASFLNKEGLE